MAAMISSNGALAGASPRSRHQSEMSCTLLENSCFSSVECFRKMQGGSGG